jgi:hypothetical protein
MSVSETNSFEFLKKIDLDEVYKMGIESLKKDFGRVLELDINDLKINIADEERQLFLKVNRNIRDFSNEYRAAGKWLDEEYNPKKFYLRNIKKLEVLTEHWQAGWLGNAKNKERQAAEILTLLLFVKSYGLFGAEGAKTKEDKELSADTKLALQKLKWTIEGMPPFSTKHALLADAVNNLLENPTANSFMSIEVARRICLITWILTEPDMEKSNLGITGFENWPWIGDQGRFSLNYFWRDQNYSKWVSLVKIAWTKIEAEQITEKPGETKQRNKDIKEKHEGTLEPKPPETLQKILWIRQNWKKYWKLLILAGLILLIFFSGIFIWPKFDLFGGFYHSTKKEVLNDYGRTPLYARTKKGVDDFYEKIENEKLNPWIFINTGVNLQITEYNGKVISSEGVTFEGAPRVIFWSDDFIPPFIEDAIIKVFDQTIEECRKNNLYPKPYLYEANGLLTGFIHKIYNRMAEIDRMLQGKGYPKNTQRRDVTEEIGKMEDRLKGHYDAALLLVSKTDKKWYEIIPSKTIGGIIFLAALTTLIVNFNKIKEKYFTKNLGRTKT